MTQPTFGLGNLAGAFDGIRKSAKEWKYRALKAEEQLEELRMRLHQVGMPDPKVKADALNFLRAEATSYHARLQSEAS